jgi:hypothetical protein
MIRSAAADRRPPRRRSQPGRRSPHRTGSDDLQGSRQVVLADARRNRGCRMAGQVERAGVQHPAHSLMLADSAELFLGQFEGTGGCRRRDQQVGSTSSTSVTRLQITRPQQSSKPSSATSRTPKSGLEISACRGHAINVRYPSLLGGRPPGIAPYGRARYSWQPIAVTT